MQQHLMARARVHRKGKNCVQRALCLLSLPRWLITQSHIRRRCWEHHHHHKFSVCMSLSHHPRHTAALIVLRTHAPMPSASVRLAGGGRRREDRDLTKCPTALESIRSAFALPSLAVCSNVHVPAKGGARVGNLDRWPALPLLPSYPLTLSSVIAFPQPLIVLFLRLQVQVRPVVTTTRRQPPTTATTPPPMPTAPTPPTDRSAHKVVPPPCLPTRHSSVSDHRPMIPILSLTLPLP